EPVTRMDGVRTGRTGGLDDSIGPEVTLGRGTRSDVDGLIRVAHVPRAAIAIRVDRHGPEPHLAAGTDDADGDLAAVRDKDLHRAIVIVPNERPAIALRRRRPEGPASAYPGPAERSPPGPTRAGS